MPDALSAPSMYSFREIPAAPELSEAWTLTVTLPLTIPAVELVIATTGGVVSAATGAVALATFTEIVVDTPALPAASCAKKWCGLFGQ